MCRWGVLLITMAILIGVHSKAIEKVNTSSGSSSVDNSTQVYDGVKAVVPLERNVGLGTIHNLQPIKEPLKNDTKTSESTNIQPEKHDKIDESQERPTIQPKKVAVQVTKNKSLADDTQLDQKKNIEEPQKKKIESAKPELTISKTPNHNSNCIRIKSHAEYMDIIHTIKNKLVIMDLGTRKSDAWKFLTPQLEAAAVKFKESVLFLIVDYLDAPQIYWDIRCQYIPTLVAFYNGRVVDAFVSTWEPEVERRIQKLLGECIAK